MRDDVDLARHIAARVLLTPGVHGLSEGTYAQAATYGPGVTIHGVCMKEDGVEIHLIASYPTGFPIPELVERVRERVGSVVESGCVDVVVDDFEMEDGVDRLQ